MQHANRTNSLKLIRDLEIPLGMIASVAQVAPARVSDFCRNRPLPSWQEQKIISVVEDISFVWSAFRRGAPGVKIVIDSPQILKKLVAACKQTELPNEVSNMATEATDELKNVVSEASEAFRAAFAR